MNIRKPIRRVSKNAILLYNGSPKAYEDPADYIDIRAVLKGRVIA